MAKSALLVMDLQKGIIGRVDNLKAYLDRVSATIKAARQAKVQIIYIVTAFRPNYPDMSDRNNMFSHIASMEGGMFTEGSDSVAIADAVQPLEGDIVVTKRRVSAFGGTDMEVILRSLDIVNLVLAGIATSGAILSSIRQGADLDFELTLLEDLCFDPDPEVHDILVKKVFPRQANVVKSQEWSAGLRGDTA